MRKWWASVRAAGPALLLAAILVPGLAAAAPGFRSVPANGERLGRTELLLIAGFGTAAVVAKNNENSRWLSGQIDGSFVDGAIDIADRYGDGVTLGVAALGLTALGQRLGISRIEQAGSGLSQSLVAAWGVTWALKLSINAKRPNGGSYSFPSGHTSTAFAAAPVFHRHFGPWIGYPAYAMATLTAMARMEENKHHLSDVVAGAAIGIIAGRTFGAGDGFSLRSSANGSGIGVSYRF